MLVQYSLPYPTCHTRTGFIWCWYSLPYPTCHTRTVFIQCWYNTVTVPDMPHKNRFHMMLVQYSLPYPTCHTRTVFTRCWYNTVYRTRHATQEQFSYDVGIIQFTVPAMPHKNSFHTMLVQYSLPCPTCHTRTGFIRCWYNTVYRARHATQEQVSYDVGTIQFTVPDMPHKNSFHMMLVQYSLPCPTCHTRTVFTRCWYNTVYRTRHPIQEQFSYNFGTIQFTVPDMPHKNSFHTILVQYS